jgi:hypothetical protein
MTEDDRYWWMDPKELERLARWSEDRPPTEDEELKEALRLQQHKEHFEAPDPSDNLTDDQIMGMLPKHYREDR